MNSYQIPQLTDHGAVLGNTLTSAMSVGTLESGSLLNRPAASTVGAGPVETASLNETSGEGN
jgi:hypothetical protein